METLNNIKYFKLLTPDKQGSFATSIAQERAANGYSTSGHILNERLVMSHLAYRSRYGKDCTVRQISEGTRLHYKTIKKSLCCLGDAVRQTGSKWLAVKPPVDWFVERRNCSAEDWYDRLAYIMFYVPRRGAVIKYKETTRRFGINHAAVCSQIINMAKQSDGLIRNFTCAGYHTMLGIDPKTVKAVIDDLHYAGFICVTDRGRSFDIQLQPFGESQLAYFDPKPEGKSTTPIEKKPRVQTAAYQHMNDGFDAYRDLCKPLMDVKYAEVAIAIARRLGDTHLAFDDHLADAKDQHQRNRLNGKVAKGNFGAYFVKRMQTRLDQLEEQLQEAEAQKQRREKINSPEYQAGIKADPTHPLHDISVESVLARVRFSTDALENFRQAEETLSDVFDHVRVQVKKRNLRHQDEVDAIGSLKESVLSLALKDVNGFYGIESWAKLASFQRAIDKAFVSKGMPALYNSAKIKKEAANV